MKQTDDQLLQEATPAYVHNILEKNKHIWSLYGKNTQEFEKGLQEWIADIRERLIALNKKTPQVSIILPAYNEEEHILTVLESLAAQKDAPSMEVIVVANNCKPTDKTAEIARAAGAKVIEYQLTTKKFKPIPYARQVGLEAAKGTYSFSIDADTIAMPRWVVSLYTPLEEHQDVGFATSHSHLYEKEYDKTVMENDSKRKFLRETFEWTGFIGLGNNMAFRTKEALKMGGYNLNIYPGEDTEIGVRLTIFQQKHAKLVKRISSQIWMSPRRVKKFGPDWFFSHLDWQGKILDARDSFKQRDNS